MNMQQIMAQAQKMQRDLTKKKEQIDKEIFVGKSDWVTVEFYGSKVMKSISINNDDAYNKENSEILADMIVIAVKDAISKINEEVDNRLGNMGNLGGLF